MSANPSRRRFIQSAAVLGGAALAGSTASTTRAALAPETREPAEKTDKSNPFTLRFGLASYTTRKLSLDHTLQIAKRLNLSCITLKDMHLPLSASPEITAQNAQKVRDAGLDLYGGGVIYMNSQAEVDRAFDYARAAFDRCAGMSCWMETKSECNIAVAYNHGPERGAIPLFKRFYGVLVISGLGYYRPRCIASASTSGSRILQFHDRLLVFV